jgi:cation diffusion facilitator family transporter
MTKIAEHVQLDHDHDHSEAHDHTHEHPHGHNHEHENGLWVRIASALHLPGHSHDHHSPTQDNAFYQNELAIRTVKLALLSLSVTTAIQIVIYLASGSVALLGDTVHNLGDALNSIPLWLAFVLAKRRPNRRYTYGYGRAEDVAGLVIVASIAFSAAYILWESIQKLINPQPLENLGWVAAASIVGFLGNEVVAILQIRVGRQIGSDAMIADGLHARADGLTSLAVLVAAAGAALGFPVVDPIVGIAIGMIIVFITRDAAIAIWYRLMDAVDPKIVEKAEAEIRDHAEVKAVHRLQMRWLGHRLYAETVLAMERDLKTTDPDAFTDHIAHHLYHAIPNLAEVTIGVVPWSEDRRANYLETVHHREPGAAAGGVPASG